MKSSKPAKTAGNGTVLYESCLDCGSLKKEAWCNSCDMETLTYTVKAGHSTPEEKKNRELKIDVTIAPKKPRSEITSTYILQVLEDKLSKDPHSDKCPTFDCCNDRNVFRICDSSTFQIVYYKCISCLVECTCGL